MNLDPQSLGEDFQHYTQDGIRAAFAQLRRWYQGGMSGPHGVFIPGAKYVVGQLSQADALELLLAILDEDPVAFAKKVSSITETAKAGLRSETNQQTERGSHRQESQAPANNKTHFQLKSCSPNFPFPPSSNKKKP